MLAEHLYQAERHVAQGEHQIERQCQIIHDLERGGHDTTETKALLIRFEELQLIHIAATHPAQLGDGITARRRFLSACAPVFAHVAKGHRDRSGEHKRHW
jgi:hypothetical protein